jgi:hypothetical protein
MDDGQLSQKSVATEWKKEKEKRNMLGIERSNKGKSWNNFSYCAKLVQDGFSKDGVESICDIHLWHYPIKMDV